MRHDWSQLTLNHWQKWRQEKPLWVMWGIGAIALLVYYLLVIGMLNYLVDSEQTNIKVNQTRALWMTKATQEILRLRQALPHQRIKSTSSTFTLINEAINEQGWNNLVNDVHQIDENRVQVNFNAISFNELIGWLGKLFDKNGIYVVEATLEKSQPGVVQATLVLQRHL